VQFQCQGFLYNWHSLPPPPSESYKKGLTFIVRRTARRKRRTLRSTTRDSQTKRGSLKLWGKCHLGCHTVNANDSKLQPGYEVATSLAYEYKNRICQEIYRTSRMVRGSIPNGGKIFRIRPDRPWRLHCLLYNGYWVILGGKAAEAWR
jgi:hypothetical protein